MTEALTIWRETQIAAPPATVFAFLTDPEKILSWLGVEAKTEPHPGGLYLVKGAGGQIVHSLSTTIIGPDGKVYKWYSDNDWKPDDLIADAAQAAQQTSQSNASPHPATTIPTA